MRHITLEEGLDISPIMRDIYRRLRTNIEFTGLENRAICITSCFQNSGKSTVSFCLAKSFSDDGRTVLLIDADMRNSTFAAVHGMKKDTKGLSNFLSGKEKLSDVIYETNFPKLFILPTGVFPVNPTELLNKPRFAKLIETVKESFDYVIVDTPPLGMVVDPAIIAKECDGSILIISADRVSRRVALDVRNQLKQANDNILGVVLNQVDMKSKKYGYGYGYGYGRGYGYGYGRGYGYGYGYGNTPDDQKESDKKEN